MLTSNPPNQGQLPPCCSDEVHGLLSQVLQEVIGLMTPSGTALLPRVVRVKRREGLSPLSKPLHSKQEAGPSFPCPCLPGSWSESPKSRASSTLLLNQGRLSLEAGFEIIYAHVWPVCRQPLFAACGWRFIALGFISGSNKNLPENYHDSRQDNNEINLWNCKSAPATFFAL